MKHLFLPTLLSLLCLTLTGAEWTVSPEGICDLDATASDGIDQDNNAVVDDCSNASDAFNSSGTGYIALARDFMVVPPATLQDDLTVTGGKVLVFGGDSPRHSGMAVACGVFLEDDTKFWVNVLVSAGSTNTLWPMLDSTVYPDWDNSFAHIPLGNQTSTVYTWDVLGSVGSNDAFKEKRPATNPVIYTLSAGRHCLSIWGQTGARVAAIGATAGDSSDDFLNASVPVISNLASGTPTTSSVTLTWDTTINTDTQIDYGLTAAYGTTTTLDATLVTEHSVSLTGLVSNTTYHWRARSRAGDGTLTTSADQTFVTPIEVTTGTIKVLTVGENSNVNTAPYVNVQINALTPALRNTINVGLSTGPHTVKITDVRGLDPHYGTCNYPQGGSECTITSYPTAPTCDGTNCTAPITVTAGEVTKVEFQEVAGPRISYATSQVGGKLGSVIVVNSPGDLIALETTYKNGGVYVTFGTGGTYTLGRNIVLTGSNITIDCYTAPGRDITFTNYGFAPSVVDRVGGDHATGDIIIQGCNFDKGPVQFDPTDADVNLIRVAQTAPQSTYSGSNVVDGVLLYHNSFLNCMAECVRTQSRSKNITLLDNFLDLPTLPGPTLGIGDRTDRVAVLRNVILGPQGIAQSFAAVSVAAPTGPSHVASNLFGTSQDGAGAFNAIQFRQGADALFENNTLLPLGNDTTLGTINLAGNSNIAAHPYKFNNNVVVCHPTANSVAGSAAETVWCPTPTPDNTAGDILIRNNAFPFGACSTCTASAITPDLLSTVVTAPSVPTVTLEDTANSACHAFQRVGPFPRSAAATTRLAQVVLSNCVGTSQPAFDFTISTPSGSLPVTQGASATLTVTLGLFSGVSNVTTFSVTGLPANVTASYNKVSCAPGCSAVLTVTAGSSATVASTLITVTGTAGALTHSTTFTLVVNAPAPASPVGFWKMDEGSGLALNDSSGFNNTLAISEATWTTGPTALSFDGVNDIAQTLSLSSQVPAAKTITAWVYWLGGGHADGWIAGNPSEGWLIIHKATGQVCYQDNAMLAGAVCSAAVLVPNTWTFVAVRSTGAAPQAITLWVGGTAVARSATTAPPLAPGFQQFAIGGVALGPTSRPVNARIRYVRLYLTAISDAELTTLSQELSQVVQTVDTPTFSPVAGNYTPGSTQNVAITTQLTGTSIYYTIDGSTPTTGSTLYSTPVVTTAARTIKAIAVKAGYQDSAVATAVYTFNAIAGCDTAGLQVPCHVTALRTVIVDSAGGPGYNYTNLQSALTNAQAGDHILIKKNASGYATGGIGAQSGGTDFALTVSGTQAAPILIASYDVNNKAVITDDLWIGAGAPVIGGQWTIVEDLEFSNPEGGGAGMRLFAQHITIRRIYTHNNYFQGMWLDNSHVLVEDSTFSDNGSQGNGTGCMGDWRIEQPGDEWDPAHCHGIYGGGPPIYAPNYEFACEAPHHVTIRRNLFQNNGGAGFQQFINTNNCKDQTLSSTGQPWMRKAHDYLIENNIFRNNGQDIYMVGMARSTIRNNTIVKTSVVDQNGIPLEMLDWFDTNFTGVDAVKVYNNLWVSPFARTASSGGPTEPWYIMNSSRTNDHAVDFNYNGYFVQGDTGFRDGADVNRIFNFMTEWKSVTGEDANGIIHDIDITAPGFVNMASGDFHITAGSIVRGKGLVAQCPTDDFYKVTRTAGACDLGAVGYH